MVNHPLDDFNLEPMGPFKQVKSRSTPPPNESIRTPTIDWFLVLFPSVLFFLYLIFNTL